MALSLDDLRVVEDLLGEPDVDDHTFGALRRRFPTLSWTSCDASDVDEEPFRTCGRFDIHLLDSSDHCARIITDLTRATGVVLARRMAS